MKLRELLVEITVTVDEDEVDTAEKLKEKMREIRNVINNIDPAIGVFLVENIQ